VSNLAVVESIYWAFGQGDVPAILVEPYDFDPHRAHADKLGLDSSPRSEIHAGCGATGASRRVVA
jgi:hypothetical protein